MDGTPVFSAAIEVDGTSKQWKAGVDDYYMFSEFEKDPFDVYVFKGRLQQQNCLNNCEEILTIKIRDLKQTTGVFSGVEEALRVDGDYGFYFLGVPDTIWQQEIITIGYTAQFDASESYITPGLNPTYNWDFNDTMIQINSPFVTYIFDSTQLAFPVKLTLNANNITSGSITQPFAVGNQNPLQCKFENIAYDSLDSTLHIEAVVSGGTPPYSYSWNNGIATPAADLIVNPNGQFIADFTVIDASGAEITASASSFFNPGANPNFFIPNFSYGNITPITEIIDTFDIIPLDSLQFSNITIEYTDTDGHFYSSDRLEQSPDAYFEIIKSEDYDNNELGQKTRKLTVRFACELLDAAGEMVIFKEGEAVIAVAYP